MLLRQKKKERLRILYRCFRRELYLLAYSKLKNAELAEDMVQETFVTVAQNLDHIDEKAYRFLGEYIKAKEKREDITLTQFSREKKDRSHARAWGYMTTKEIGRMLQKSEENVRQILSRGKKMLKEKLRKGGYDENLWF